MSFLKSNGDRYQYSKLRKEYEENKAAWEEKYNIKERKAEARSRHFSFALSLKEMIECPVPPSRVLVDKESGTIDLFAYGESNPYPIAAKRIKTQKRLLHWIVHLSEKGWFDNEMLRDFIAAVFWVNGWGDYHGPI